MERIALRPFGSIQRSLLVSAVKSLKLGGRLVYSTCTVAPQENEANVDFRSTNSRWSRKTSTSRACAPSWTDRIPARKKFHPTCTKPLFYPVDRVTEGFTWHACAKPAALVRRNHASETAAPRVISRSQKHRR
ncbi:MAG: hypothetical protein R3C26_02480 [Calditrichia bacterium]